MLSAASPSSSVDDSADRVLPYSEFIGNALLRFHACGVSQLNSSDISLGELGIPVLHSVRRLEPKNVERMTIILTLCRVFEVFRSVVSRVAIFVIDIMFFRAWAYERKHDQLMNEISFGATRTMQGDSFIATLLRRGLVWLENMVDVSISSDDIGTDAANLSSIRDFVGLKSRDWFPDVHCFFNERKKL